MQQILRQVFSGTANGTVVAGTFEGNATTATTVTQELHKQQLLLYPNLATVGTLTAGSMECSTSIAIAHGGTGLSFSRLFRTNFSIKWFSSCYQNIDGGTYS